MPKLWTYKDINDTFCVQPYIKANMPRKDRSQIAQIRCGVFPLKID